MELRITAAAARTGVRYRVFVSFYTCVREVIWAIRPARHTRPTGIYAVLWEILRASGSIFENN